jgi:hypothetical protein
MKKIAFLIFINLFILSCACLYSAPNNAESKILIDKIFNDFGVKITFDTAVMIPELWFASPINGKASKLDAKYYSSSLKSIEAALKRYPKKFLEKSLYSLGLCGSLSFYNIEYEGTAVYENHGIILAIRDSVNAEWIDATVSHELNHLLVCWNDFPKEEWIKCNKEGFVYGEGGAAAIQTGKSSTDKTESSFDEGFVCEYSKSDFIEDVATLAGYAMADRKDFYNRALRHPIIKKKFEIMKKFYHDLDNFFDEKYWNGDVKINYPNGNKENNAGDDSRNKRIHNNSNNFNNEDLPDEDDRSSDNTDNSFY